MELCKVISFLIIEITIVHLIALSQCAKLSMKDNFNNHNIRVKNFKCSEPQPRSLRLDEFAEESDLADISPWEVFPMLTVLHRCDSQAGCCTSNLQRCRPRATEQVTLTYLIIAESHGKNKRLHTRHPKNQYIHVNAVNHTECHCSSIYEHPK